MKHLVLTGACYVDTILSVPYFPGEDEKLRATTAQVRRGGNCPNSIEVLQQLLGRHRHGAENDGGSLRTHLIAVLPERGASATTMIADSFGLPSDVPAPNLDLCLYRPGHAIPASSYIIRSAATSSRTIVNYYGLPEMETKEFRAAAGRFFESHQSSKEDSSLWHFEGRIPKTTLSCIKYLRSQRQSSTGTGKDITVSVEMEKPEREGLRELAAVSNVVFFSKTWAESEGYLSAEACLRGEGASLPDAAILFCTWGAQGAAAVSPRSGGSVVSCRAPYVPAENVVDSVGAGDTFVAGALYRLATSTSTQEPNGVWKIDNDTIKDMLTFAVSLATRKVQIDGFQGLV